MTSAISSGLGTNSGRSDSRPTKGTTMNPETRVWTGWRQPRTSTASGGRPELLVRLAQRGGQQVGVLGRAGRPPGNEISPL